MDKEKARKVTFAKKTNPMHDETRLALLEQSVKHTNIALIEIKTELATIRNDIFQRFEKVDGRLQRIDDRFIRIEEKIDDKFKWTMGVMITLFSGLYATALGGMIARLCRWI